MLSWIAQGIRFPILTMAGVAFLSICHDSRSQSNQEKKDLKIFASAGDWGALKFKGEEESQGYGFQVVRKAADKKTTEELEKILKVQKIDWDKQMVVMLQGSAGRTPQHRCEFGKIIVVDGVLTCELVDSGDEPQCYKQHFAIALVEKFSGKIDGKIIGRPR
jgi:hypothetical protein